MSEYLTYTLWRQREERMPHELERQRVVQERLGEQAREKRLRGEGVLDVSPERGTGEAPETTELTETGESAEQTETAGELEPEFANR
jgi:hypothetical protein